MALHWPTFFTRLWTAAVFAIVMMAGLLWNHWSFAALVALIQFLCLRDYLRLMPKIYPEAPWPGALGFIVQGFSVVLLALAFWFFLFHMNAAILYLWPLAIAVPLLLQTNKFARDARLQALGGMLYIAMPMTMLLLLGLRDMLFPVALILMIWTNDTMAYIVGSLIGKTPFSKISPKKTWEGTAGGALLTVAGAGIFGYFTSHYRIADWIVLALCAAVAGTIGDLFESKLKRMANVKDSGTMMPGHGGALDRFDSLLFATPFAFLYVYLFVH